MTKVFYLFYYLIFSLFKADIKTKNLKNKAKNATIVVAYNSIQ